MHRLSVSNWKSRVIRFAAFALLLSGVMVVRPASAAANDGGSIEFDGSSGVSYASSNNLYLTGDYTVELWLKFSGIKPRGDTRILSRWKSGSTEYRLYANSNSEMRWTQMGSGGENNVTFTTPSLDSWHHIAAVRSGNNMAVYVDGVSAGTATFSGTVLSAGTSPLEIGGMTTATAGSVTNKFIGRVSSVRISTTPLYTGAFTPSTSPISADASSTLFLKMEPGASYLADSVNNAVSTVTGTAESHSDVPFITTTPAAPQRVRGTSNQGTTSTITWTGSAAVAGQGSNTYTVYGTTDGTTYSQVTGCVAVSATTCTATGLTMARGYMFKARAQNNAGYSDYSLLEANSVWAQANGMIYACADENLFGTTACSTLTNIQPYTTAVMPTPTYCTSLDGSTWVSSSLGVFDADGNMYFVSGNTIRKILNGPFAANHRCTSTLFNSSALLKSPRASSLGMDAQGNMYVSNDDSVDKSIVKIFSDGVTAETYVTTANTGGTIDGITFDSDQNLMGFVNPTQSIAYVVRFGNLTRIRQNVLSFNNAVMAAIGGNKVIRGLSLNAFDDMMVTMVGGGSDFIIKFDHNTVQPAGALTCSNSCTPAQLMYDSTRTVYPTMFPSSISIFAFFVAYSGAQAAVVDSEGNTWIPQEQKELTKLDVSGKTILNDFIDLPTLWAGSHASAMKIDPSGNVWVKTGNAQEHWIRFEGATKPFLRQLTYKGTGSTPYGTAKSAQIQLDGATGAVNIKTTNSGAFQVNSTGAVSAAGNLEPGKYTVSGTALDSANTSGVWFYTLTVTKAQPTVLLSSSSNPSRVRDTVTYTATPSAFDSGTVITFRDGATSIGTCTVTVVSCSITKSNFTAGSHTVTAETAESTHYLSGISTGINQVVGTLSSSVSWTVSDTPTQGQTITLSAVVTPSDVTGTVVFKDSNNNTLCTTAALVNAAGSCTWSGSPTRGTYDVYAIYSGDAEYAQSSGLHADVSIRANQASLTWTSGSTVPYLGSLTLGTAGGSGSGAVTYTVSQNSTCVVSANILTPGAVGTICQVTATKAADGSYFSASTTPRTISVTKIDQTTALTFTNANSMVFGQELSLLATGGSGDGAISYAVTSAGLTGCTITGANLSVTGAGTCALSASRALSTNFNATAVGSRATISITVSKAAQALSFTSTVPTTPVAGGTYSVVAVSDSGLTPSLSITSGSCSLTGSTISFSATGDCIVQAQQAGDSQYLAATAITQTIAVGSRNQTLTFVAATTAIEEKTYGDTAFIVEASSTESTAVLSYSTGRNTTNSACEVSAAGVVTVKNVGTCEVAANSVGTTAFAAASQITKTIAIVADLPNAPFLISTSAGNMSATVSFTVPTYVGGSSVAGYELRAVDQTVGSTTEIVESGCSTTVSNGFVTCTVRGLQNGTNYAVKVAAVNEAGRGAFSALSTALTAATNPAAVQQLSVTENNASLVIKWDDPDSLGGGTFSAYRVYIKKSGAADFDQLHYFNVTSNLTRTITVTQESPNDGMGFDGGPTLQNGVAYDVKVVTVTTANAAELTSNTAVAYKVPRTVPGRPALAVALEVSTELVLTWSAPDSDGGSAISSYVVTFNGVACVLAQPTDTKCSVPKPTASGDYVYQVKAQNDAGMSVASVRTFSVAAPLIEESAPVVTTTTTTTVPVAAASKPETTTTVPVTAASTPETTTTVPVTVASTPETTTTVPQVATKVVKKTTTKVSTTTSTTSTTSSTTLVPVVVSTTIAKSGVGSSDGAGIASTWLLLVALLIAFAVFFVLYRRRR
jgi:hypothetical protein